MIILEINKFIINPGRKISKLTLALFFFSVIFFQNCRSVIPQTETLNQNSGSFFYYCKIKAKLTIDGKKERTRMLLKYNRSGDRIIFLGVLNQVLFEAIIRGENTLIIIPRKKYFWRGTFSDFLNNFWKLDMTYSELKDLLLKKIIPQKRPVQKNPVIRIINKKNKYLRFIINQNSNSAEFRVYPIKKKTGSIKFERKLSGYKEIELKQIDHQEEQ